MLLILHAEPKADFMPPPVKGRRPGPSSSKKAILKAAQQLFAQKGYDGASVRAIAALAKVDPAMINHHFGSKEKLFATTIEVPLDPKSHIEETLTTGSHEDLPQRLLTRFLSLWDSPHGTAAAAMLRTAMRHEWSAALLREFIIRRAMGPIAKALKFPKHEADWRISLVASQLLGLVLVRYILKIEPMASASHEDIIAAIAPNIARYLFAPFEEIQ